MIKRKSFLGFMIACCLIVSSLFVFTACNKNDEENSKAVLKVVSGSGVTTTYETVTKDIFANLEAGSTVTLLKDATIDSYIPLNKSVTIDFGGHKLTASQSGGFDIREDATIAEEVRVVLKNGTLDTYKWGAWIENGGKLTVENNLNIIANRAELKTAPGITIVDLGSQLDLFGKVKAFGETNVISGNGTAGQGNVVINIHDGAVVEGFDNGIYMPNSGTLTINAATITAKTAVYLRSGDTTINGATLNATGAKVEYSFVSGQQPATGDAVVVNAVGADKYPGGNPTLNIVKGTTINVKTENCAAIAVYNVFGNAANVNNTTQYEVVTNEI